MNKVLKSNKVLVEISKLGAEMVKLNNLENNLEYGWKGDPTFWGGHAPLLFPVVCGSRNDEIIVDGKKYPMGNHGFARKNDFELIEETDTTAIFKLSYNEDTLKMYPYKFNLYISYTLIENKLQINYKVENIDNQTIYFQIGTHPGFNCPISDNENFEDYYLEFECTENLDRLFYNSSNLLISNQSESLLQNEKVLPLRHEMFSKGALVLRDVQSKKITLKSKKSQNNVILTYENLPYLGIWQAKEAPFICIEPWYGIADLDNYEGEFKDREMIIELKKGELFECMLSIEIN